MPYVHLTGEERQEIAHLVSSGHSISEIGSRLGRHKGTISRELRRNRCLATRYYGMYAQQQAVMRRRAAKRGQVKKILSGKLLRYVKTKLKQQWSPEQIAGRLEEAHGSDLSKRISHPSIYAWIREDKASGGEFHKHLRQSHRQRRKKYGSSVKRFHVRGKVSIEDRPKIVDKRRRMGDWEGDLMEGKDRKSYLLTIVERKSGYSLMRRIPSKLSSVVRKAVIHLLQRIPARHRKTLTFDNGTEFADFKRMESALGLQVYFAHPYASWERGTNENTNGLIRQYYPKGMDLRRVTQKELAKVAQRINNRPRKRLHYQTPLEAIRN